MKKENLNGNETIKRFRVINEWDKLSSSEQNLMQVLQSYENKIGDNVEIHLEIHNGEIQVIEIDFNGLENLETDYLKFLFKKVSLVDETKYNRGDSSSTQLTYYYNVEITLK